MPSNIPITVVLTTQGTTYPIAPALLDDVVIGSTAPGGFASLTCSLARPIDRDQVELNPYTEVEAFDTRTGEALFYGRLEDPGRGSSRVWALSAVGGSSMGGDMNRAVVYVDTRLDQWTQYEKKAAPSSQFGQTGDTADPDTQALTFSFPKGTAVTPTYRVAARYDALRSSGQYLTRLSCDNRQGLSTSTWVIDLVGRGGPATEASLASAAFTTGWTALGARRVADFTGNHLSPEIRMYFPSSGTAFTTANDNYWMEVRNVSVKANRVDRTGVEITDPAAYSGAVVSPAQVVEDVVGRFFLDVDGASSFIDATSPALIEQMAYEDGVTGSQVLADVMALAPTHWWAVWGRGPSGKPLFEWKPWPTEVGLDGLDTQQDEFTMSGSAADLYNEVTVRYKDPHGKQRSVVVTVANATLTAAGLTRRGALDLGSQIGTKATALSAGANFLAAHQYPSNGGTIKVSRPVTDWSTGRMLDPWQIRPGVLARVGNLQPRPDDLNPTPDGSTIFRVSDVSFSAKSGEATLTLDSYDRTVARALARLSRAAARTRRV